MVKINHNEKEDLFMKKIFVFILCCIAIRFGVNAQNKVVTSAVMSFEKTAHDFGTVKKGEETTYDFNFTNTGNEPLMLSRPRSNCGCTVPEWPQEPIMPGQTNKIRVKYNSSNTGPINRQVTVISNASNSPVVLQIKGTVVE